MKAETLKKSILQHAVQGKLVPQNPTDVPASELLKRIKSEKEQLIKDGKIKKEKPLSPITDDEIPYKLPQGWEWVRLGEIGNWGSGSTPNKARFDYYKNGTIPWLKTGDLNDGYINEIPEKITGLALKETSVKVKPVGSLLIAMYGATIGKLGILNIEATTNQACCACIKHSDLNTKFLFYYLLSERDNLRKKGEGGAQPNISREKLIDYLMPLPPLAEQQRIVKKLEQILPLVEEYGKNEEKLSELNKTLPDKIKQSILQHAVQGKLVPQNPTDEPASELLKRIKAEKEQLIKDGKIKKEKPLPPITDDEIPFSTPDSWTWCRLGTILEKLTDGAHSTPKYVSSGIPFISVKDISQGFISFDNTKFITKGEHEELCKRCDPKKGDILLTKVGTTGIPVIVDTDVEFSLFVSVAQLRFNHSYINANYIKYLILSPLVQMQCKENTKGVGNKNWVIKDIANTLIILPPLAEQQRIVDKVEELMQIINKLEVVR